MQNYNFVKNDVFVAKICKYALYESSEGLFCAPRKAANFCHPGGQMTEKCCLAHFAECSMEWSAECRVE